MKNLIFPAIIILIYTGFISCKKTDNINSSITLEDNLKAAVTELVSTQVNQVSTQDVQSASVDLYNGLGAIRENSNKHGGTMFFKIPRLSSCATVTVSDSVYPKEITIDYGTGCADWHHHKISGKIIINISDTLTKAGATKTILFKDFYVDSVKVEFNASYKNLGTNSEGNWVIESISEQTVTLSDGSVMKQSDQENTTWISGFGTTAKEDDKFYKSGSGSVSINDSLTYSRTITKPLLYDKSCDYILSGTVELYKNGNKVVIDYGDGTCDNVATVTTNGVTEQINLNSHEFGMGGEFRRHSRGFGKFGGH